MGNKRHKPEEIVTKLRQVKEPKKLQKGNEQIRKAVAELTLDKQIFREAAKGNF